MSGITLAHTFVSAKGNGTDLTLIQPSNWNDQHVIKLDANMLLGKLTTGNGPVEQIPLSAFMATLLGATSAVALANLIGGFTTGDGKITLKTAADTGWVMCNDGTIGNTGSGANFADPSTQALFTLLYGNITDAGAPVQTSAGAASTRAAQGTAAAAWAAACRMRLPLQLGRAIVSAGVANGGTSRPLGNVFGADTGNLAANQIPAGVPSSGSNAITVYPAGNSSLFVPWSTSSWSAVGAAVGGNYMACSSGGGGSIAYTSAFSGSNAISVASTNASQAAVSVAQASAAWNVMVKL